MLATPETISICSADQLVSAVNNGRHGDDPFQLQVVALPPIWFWPLRTGLAQRLLL